MNGQQMPIPGCSEPKIVAHRVDSRRARLADVRPDVTLQGADQG
jgi:hypothetical protein